MVDHADRVGVGDVQGAVEEVNVLREVVGDATLADTCESVAKKVGVTTRKSLGQQQKKKVSISMHGAE